MAEQDSKQDGPVSKAHILHYDSKSHGAKSEPPQPFVTRYFVGFLQTACPVHGFHLKPNWTYDKSAATPLMDEDGPAAKGMCESAGYKELTLTPIDSLPAITEVSTADLKPGEKSGADIVKQILNLPNMTPQAASPGSIQVEGEGGKKSVN